MTTENNSTRYEKGIPKSGDTSSPNEIQSKALSELFVDPSKHETLIASVENKDSRDLSKDKSRTRFDDEAVKIQKLISQLGNGDETVHTNAQRLLERRGPTAIPALKKALGHPDIEVRARAQHSIGIIEQKLDKERREDYKLLGPCLEAVTPIIQSYEKLLQKAGCKDYLVEVRGVGRSATYQYAIPPDANRNNDITKEQQNSFDDLIKKLDTFPVNDPDFSRVRKTVTEDGFMKDGSFEAASMAYLSIVPKAKEEARRYYADILSQSTDKENLQKGVKLLTEYIQDTDIKPDYNFHEMALRLGADRNKDFLAALEKKHGEAKVKILHLHRKFHEQFKDKQ